MNEPVLDQLADIFSMFHDGSLSYVSGDHEKLLLQIDCQYLAELLDKSFNSFYLELEEISYLTFDPWERITIGPIQLKTELAAIFCTELEIMDGEIADQKLEITCLQFDEQINFSGGTLYLVCKGFSLYNHLHEPLTIDQLYTISTSYWSKFGTSS